MLPYKGLRSIWKCYLTKAGVAFGNAFQILQAVFFPLPENVEAVSQPVTAYQNSRARQFSSFKTVAYVWIGSICDFDQLQFLSTAHQDLTKKNDVMQLRLHQCQL